MTDKWYDKTPQQIGKMLKTNLAGGLSKAEAEKRLKKYGKNTLYPLPKGPINEYIHHILTDITSYILVITAIICAIYGNYPQAVVMVVMLLINTAITVFTYMKAQGVLSDMGYISLPDAKVIRGGKLYLLKQDQLVPGDIVFISAGDIVPADVRLLESDGLIVNEFTLTGVKRPVVKDAGYAYIQTIPIEERKNVLYATTVVIAGTGKAVVCDTGDATVAFAMGKSKNLASHENLTVLKKIRGFCKTISLVMTGVVFILTVLDLIIGIGDRTLADTFLTGLALAVAAMSEFYSAFGYIIVSCGIFNALSRYKDINSGAIVKNIESIQDLRDISCIIVPKESILTLTHPDLDRIYTDDKEYDGNMRDFKEKTSRLLRLAVISTGIYTKQKLAFDNANAENIYTTEEDCILTTAQNGEVYNTSLEEEYFFLAHRKKGRLNRFETTLARHVSGNIMVMRGDPGGVLACCRHYSENGILKPLTGEKLQELLYYVKETTKKAYKVLGVATRAIDADNLDLINSYQSNMTFEGFLCIKEPLLPGVALNVQKCRDAGIKVIMTSGESTEGNEYIADALSIIQNEDDILYFNNFTDADMESERVRVEAENTTLYQGINQKQLRTVIGWLKESGYRVAILNRGLNDLELTQCADVDFAQSITISPKANGSVDIRSLASSAGRGIPIMVKNPSSSATTGCDAIRFVSDVIVSEPAKSGSGGFNGIIGAISCAKVIYQNLLSTVRYLIASQLAKLIIVFFAVIFGSVYFTPVQLLFCGLVLDLGAVISIAFEKPGTDILKAKNISDAHFDRVIKNNPDAIAMGIIWALITIISPVIMDSFGFAFTAGQIRTAAFIGFALTQIIILFEVKKEKSMFRSLSFNGMNMVYITVVLFIIALALLISPIGIMFDMVAIPWQLLVYSVALPILSIGFCELMKLIVNKLKHGISIFVFRDSKDESKASDNIINKLFNGVNVDARDEKEEYSLDEIIESHIANTDETTDENQSTMLDDNEIEQIKTEYALIEEEIQRIIAENSKLAEEILNGFEEQQSEKSTDEEKTEK